MGFKEEITGEGIPTKNRMHCPKCGNEIFNYKDPEYSNFFTNNFILKCPACGWWKYGSKHPLAHKNKSTFNE